LIDTHEGQPDYMTCSHPGTVAADDLVGYASGDVDIDPRVVGHVQECPECAETVEAYRETETVLRGALFRFDCPAPQAIGEYELQLLAPDEMTAVAAHTLDCAYCTDELRTLRTFLATPMVPETSVGSRVARVVASLVAPGRWAPPGLAGALRSTGEGGSAVYQAEGLTVRVSLGPPPRQAGTVSLVGVVLAEGADASPRGQAALLAEAGGSAARTAVLSVDIDDLGSFTFDAVPAGTYTLELRLADRVVVIERLRASG